MILKINDKLGIDDSNKSVEEIMKDIDKELNTKTSFYKKNSDDVIWWVENPDMIGEHLFSFDKEKVFNLFKDYPYALSTEQKEIFDKENPYWANYFKDR